VVGWWCMWYIQSGLVAIAESGEESNPFEQLGNENAEPAKRGTERVERFERVDMYDGLENLPPEVVRLLTEVLELNNDHIEVFQEHQKRLRGYWRLIRQRVVVVLRAAGRVVVARHSNVVGDDGLLLTTMVARDVVVVMVVVGVAHLNGKRESVDFESIATIGDSVKRRNGRYD
jgi:hypothetical protein